MERKLFTLFGALLVVGALASTAAPSAYADNALSASAGVIALGGTVDLTQELDVTGTVNSLLVLEPDGDLCSATTTPAAVSSGSDYVAEYPTDFAWVTGGGDGSCDTSNIGVYNAESQVEGDLGIFTFDVEFETNFFVIPESPVGVAALMGSSLAALGGYLGLRRFKAVKA